MLLLEEEESCRDGRVSESSLMSVSFDLIVLTSSVLSKEIINKAITVMSHILSIGHSFVCRTSNCSPL